MSIATAPTPLLRSESSGERERIDEKPFEDGGLTREFCLRHQLVPLGWQEGRLQIGATEVPPDDVLEALRFSTGTEVELKVLSRDEAELNLKRLGAIDARRGLTPAGALESGGGDHSSSDVLPREPEEAALFGQVQALITDAVERRASDIHVEPLSRSLRVRYRIDGGLVEVRGPAKEMQLPLVSRLKIMANISIAEQRIPQDGRIAWNAGGRPVDLRVSTLPTAHGESVVMRLLDQESVRPRFDELGLGRSDDAILRQLISRHDGMVLVTGPTGSGKTTTLYSCLQSLNQRERKIITVEDPIEYQLAGVNQVPVRPEVGMTFASALRALLRQSPNVIMVGEIRDAETAEMAVHAALTGHLVFSTLHTNDAAGAVTRLIDLGIKPYLVAAALRGSLAQRLVRRICPGCRHHARPGPTELQAFEAALADDAHDCFAIGRGCPRCHGTGYYGRLGVFETFVVDPEIERLINERMGIATLRAAARKRGHRSLRADAFAKAKCGLTTLSEVASIAASGAAPSDAASI